VLDAYCTEMKKQLKNPPSNKIKTRISRKMKPHLLLQNCALDPVGDVMRPTRIPSLVTILPPQNQMIDTFGHSE